MHRYIAFKATPCDTAPPFASLSVTSSAASFNSVEGIGLTWGSSNVRSASDVLLQSIDLAVAAEELGLDGAYFRVHHFARQLASPFPLLAAAGSAVGVHHRQMIM